MKAFRRTTSASSSRPSSSSSSAKSFSLGGSSSHQRRALKAAHQNLSSSSSSSLSSPATGLSKMSSFPHFTQLPTELQIYILSFLPARTLHKTIGRANKHYAAVIDAHIRRRIVGFVRGDDVGKGGGGDYLYHHGYPYSPAGDKSDASGTSSGRPSMKKPETLLMFEAQRPIDTLTSKHPLHFSHFSVTSSVPNPHGDAANPSGEGGGVPGGAYSTIANFTFVPVQHPHSSPSDGQVNGERSGAMNTDTDEESMTSSMELSQPSTRYAPHGAVNAFAGTPTQPNIPTVHDTDVSRTGTESVSSSVSRNSNRNTNSLLGRSSPRSIPVVDRRSSSSASGTPRASSPNTNTMAGRRLFTDVSAPMEWRESQRNPTRLVPADEEDDIAQADDEREPAHVSRENLSHSVTPRQNQGQGGGEVSGRGTRGRAHEGYEGFQRAAPRVSGGWAEPVASTSAAYDGDYYATSSEEGGSRDRRARMRMRAKKPTYRFQLDPLDSFETWILSLTVQRKSDAYSSSGPTSEWRVGAGGTPRSRDMGFGVGPQVGPDPSRAFSRPMRWEKRVAEGLDRVFRDWFTPPSQEIYDGIGRPYSSLEFDRRDGTVTNEGESALARAHLISNLGAGLGAFHHPEASMLLSRHQKERGGEGDKMEEDDEDINEEASIPDARVLEFDGPSCTISIQPHSTSTTSDNSHPALASTSSHAYLSHPSLSAQYASLSSRVELTFHCETVSINAARLLSTLEDVEIDVSSAQAMARAGGGHVVAGRSSGPEAWAYGTGGSRYTSGGTRWAGTNRPDGVAVLVFGAARD